jgi:uncharacterized protein YkwD
VRRRWPRTAWLSLLAALALVAAPIALSPPPGPGSSGEPGVQVLRQDDRAARSATREPTSTVPTSTAPASTVPTSTAPASTAPTQTPSATPSVVEEIVTRTNDERVAAGVAPLTVSVCATEQAAARTALLVAEDRFEHDPLEPVLEACGARAVGENLALGYPTPLALVAGWMGSPGHRANLLNPAYTQIGVACTTAPRGPLCAQVFVG